jgi:hypothetical protein
MDADWSVDAAADDPVVVVPWTDEGGGAGFVDLLSDPGAIHLLPEAVRHDGMREALLRLNQPSSGLGSAKCDVWKISEEEMESLAARFDLVATGCGLGSYVDVLLTEGFASAELAGYETWARRMVRALSEGALEDPRDEEGSCAEFVVRPASLNGVWGYAVTMYVWSVGDDEGAVKQRWSRALRQVVSVLLESAPRQSTIQCAQRASSSIG